MTTRHAVPAESGIIRYFSRDRHLPAATATGCYKLIHCIYIKSGAFVTFMNDTLLLDVTHPLMHGT